MNPLTEKRKPCRVCGGWPVIDTIGSAHRLRDARIYKIRCSRCGFETAKAETEAAVWKLWEERR